MMKTALATTAAAALLAGAAFAQEAAQPVAPTMETQEEGTAILPETGADMEADQPFAQDQGTMGSGDPTLDQAEEIDPAVDAPVIDQTLDPAAPQADDEFAVEPVEPMEGDDLAAEPVTPLDGDDMAVDGAMGMEGYAAIDLSTLSADRLMGTDIVNYEGETVATVDDVVITDTGEVEGLVARFGGFLGFGTNRVQLAMDEIEVMQDESETMIVRTRLAPEEIESRPEYEAPATN